MKDKKLLVRDSNMELLRIIAMLFVIVCHTVFFSLGKPTMEEAINSPIRVLGLDIVNSTCIICVNLFVLISGWYGIKPKIKRFIGLLFQVFFLEIVTLLLFSLLFHHRFDMYDVKSIFLMTWNLWFVKAYIILYLLAIPLNLFSQAASKRQFQLILLAFFSFQTIYGWGIVTVQWINEGYSPVCFIGLYLLARYIRLYHDRVFSLSPKYDILISLLLILTNAVIPFLSIRHGKDTYMWTCSFASPIVILYSVYFMLFFSKIHFKSSFVNWVSCSCFAVYLVHCARNVLEKYCEPVANIFSNNDLPIALLKVTLLIISIFTISILLDKLRILIWARIQKRLQLE